MDILTNGVLTDPAAFALIIGFLLPHVIAIAQQPRYPNWLRTLVAVVFCALAGTLTAYFTGDFSGLSIVSSILLVLVSAITFYQNVWKHLGTTRVIERKILPGPSVDKYAPVGPFQEGPPEVEAPSQE